MKLSHFITSLTAVLFCIGCNLNQPKPVAQPCNNTNIEDLINIPKQDTTTIDRTEIWIIFRGIYESGLVKGLSMAERSYESFKNLTEACGVKWDDYLDGVEAPRQTHTPHGRCYQPEVTYSQISISIALISIRLAQ